MTGLGIKYDSNGALNVPQNLTVKGTTRFVSSIVDVYGNELLKFSTVASAVNEVTITNAATGNGPLITGTGETNVPITVKGSGTGKVILGQATTGGVQLAADQALLDSSANELIKFTKTGSAVNEVTVVNAATGTSPRLDVSGGDANAGFEVRTKGTGWFHQRADTVAGTNGSIAFHRAVTTKTNDGTNTISVAEMRGGIWEHSGLTSGRTDTTPTAAELVADFPGVQVGTTYMVLFANTDNDQVLTIAGGSNVNVVGDATIPAGVVAVGFVHFTNVTSSSEAATLYMTGTNA